MITETTESNLIVILPLIQRLMVVIMLSVFMGGCANSATCVRGDGRWSDGFYSLGSKEIKKGEDIDYFATLDCWGIYRIWLDLLPRKMYILGQGVHEDGRNNYYVEVPGEEGTVYRKLLQPYSVRLEMTISSSDNTDKEITIQKEWVQPPTPYTFTVHVFAVPRDFSAGESLRIRYSVFAEEGFFDEYGSVFSMINRNMVID